MYGHRLAALAFFEWFNHVVSVDRISEDTEINLKNVEKHSFISLVSSISLKSLRLLTSVGG